MKHHKTTSRTKRIPVTADLRQSLSWVYRNRCQYCNTSKEVDDLQVDHIVPFSKGGANCLSNYTIACRDCNSKKSNLSLSEAGVALLVARASRTVARMASLGFSEDGIRVYKQPQSKPWTHEHSAALTSYLDTVEGTLPGNIEHLRLHGDTKPSTKQRREYINYLRLQPPNCIPSNVRLAALFGVSERSIREDLKRLDELNTSTTTGVNRSHIPYVHRSSVSIIDRQLDQLEHSKQGLTSVDSMIAVCRAITDLCQQRISIIQSLLSDTAHTDSALTIAMTA
jgi:hypothetical protein